MMNIATTTLNCLDTAISISEITRAAAEPVLKLMLATTNVLSAYIRVARMILRAGAAGEPERSRGLRNELARAEAYASTKMQG